MNIGGGSTTQPITVFSHYITKDYFTIDLIKISRIFFFIINSQSGYKCVAGIISEIDIIYCFYRGPLLQLMIFFVSSAHSYPFFYNPDPQ